jgi:hypothetical protein
VKGVGLGKWSGSVATLGVPDIQPMSEIMRGRTRGVCIEEIGATSGLNLRVKEIVASRQN